MINRRRFLSLIPISFLFKRTRANRDYTKRKSKFDYSHIYISPEALEDIRNWNIDLLVNIKKDDIL